MKKLISFILAAMLIFSVLPVGAATFTDSNADNSEEKIGLMTKLGIIDADDVFSYNKGFEISRAAFLRIANRITKTSDLTAGTLPYWDVDESNEYYKDIEAAYSFGLIDGGVGAASDLMILSHTARAQKSPLLCLGIKITPT